MDPNQVYAIVMGGMAFTLLLVNALPWLVRLCHYLSPLMSKHMVYHYLLHRHRLLGPWSRAGVLSQLIYIAGNIICVAFEVSHSNIQISNLSQAGLRAGTLSIINMIPLFAGPHLDFLADVLGVAFRTLRQIHRSAGVMAVLLGVFHTLVAVGTRPSLGLQQPQNLFAVIVSEQSLIHSVQTDSRG